MNTNKKAETSQATLPTETTRPKKKKRGDPTNNTKQKKPAKSQKPNTTKQKLLHETVELPNDATKPVKDVRLTVEELSCKFVVSLLKELWFPVCAVVEAIRNIPMRSDPDDTRDTKNNLKHKHPWAEQIIIARLVSHMIMLRDDAVYQHGINIASTTPEPLHEVMTQLSYLLEDELITVYLPELRDTAIERQASHRDHYYPEPRLAIQEFRIEFAPTPAGRSVYDTASNRKRTRNELKQAEEVGAATLQPLTFPEILEHCKDCHENSVHSVWTHLLQRDAHKATIPDSKRSKKKGGSKKNNQKREGDDEDEDETEQPPKVPAPENVKIPPEETNVSEALQSFLDELDQHGDSGGTYFQVLTHAFASSRQADGVKDYLRHTLDANNTASDNSNSDNSNERSTSSNDSDADSEDNKRGNSASSNDDDLDSNENENETEV